MDRAQEKDASRSRLEFSRQEDGSLRVTIAGSWKWASDIPSADEVRKQIESTSRVQHVIFDSQQLKEWDSGLLTFLIKVIDLCSKNNIHVVQEGLPQGVQRLLALASAVPERQGAPREATKISFLDRVGGSALSLRRTNLDMLAFIGEASIAFMRLVIGKVRFRRSDLLLIIQKCGAQALPIVSVISILVGLILVFIGAIQLKVFGAQIYVASLVGIGMVRALGAIMTTIIMAGRMGASFAAQLGTMQVNEEMDALRTLGISPMEFLVLRGCSLFSS
jgi:phospholipid/cholesterol/gamma-HCH transport system permease protein